MQISPDSLYLSYMQGMPILRTRSCSNTTRRPTQRQWHSVPSILGSEEASTTGWASAKKTSLRWKICMLSFHFPCYNTDTTPSLIFSMKATFEEMTASAHPPPTNTTTPATTTTTTSPAFVDPQPTTRSCIGRPPDQPRLTSLLTYLSSTQSDDDDTLEFWKGYPDAQMRHYAQALLSAPATEAASERVFSHGRRLTPWLRNRTSPKTLRFQIAIKSWISARLPLPVLQPFLSIIPVKK